MRSRFTLAVALVAVVGLAFGASCGGDEATVPGGAADGTAVAGSSDSIAPLGVGTTSLEPFCDALDHLIVLLAPSGRTSPAETRADFEEAIVWFAQAEKAAPPAIADDVATYSSAYGEYVDYLRTVGFDLDRVFSTDEGRQLAIDTSHTLTPAIVEYVTGTCGLSFDDEMLSDTDTSDFAVTQARLGEVRRLVDELINEIDQVDADARNDVEAALEWVRTLAATLADADSPEAADEELASLFASGEDPTAQAQPWILDSCDVDISD